MKLMKKSALVLAAALTLTTQVAFGASTSGPTLLLDKVDTPIAPSSTYNGIIAPEAVSLAVPMYSQSGQSWSSQIMQSCGSSISSAGCTLTSATMVFKYYGVAIDPGQMNSKMGASACPFVYGDAITKAGAGIVNHVTVTSPTAWSTVYTEARNSLNLGRPYIVGIKRPDTSTHFFVIKGYVNSGTVASDFTINDPAGGVVRSLSYYTANTPYRGVSYYK